MGNVRCRRRTPRRCRPRAAVHLQLGQAARQHVGHVAGRGEAVVRLLGVQPGDDRAEPLRHVRVDLPDGPRRLLADALQDRKRGRRPEGRLPRAHGVQHAAEAEQVGAVVDRFALGLLGAMYNGVPATTPDWVMLASSAARARPKSVILTRSTPFSRRMLLGLMSRWISPWRCAAASPSAVCADP